MTTPAEELAIQRARCRRDEGLDQTDKQCQPCDKYIYEPDQWHMRKQHQCPLCGGWRSFCFNCHWDHHEGGWNSCAIQQAQKCKTSHPACVERVQALPEFDSSKCACAVAHPPCSYCTSGEYRA